MKKTFLISTIGLIILFTSACSPQKQVDNPEKNNQTSELEEQFEQQHSQVKVKSEDEKAQKAENITLPVSQSEQNSKEKSVEGTNLQTYQNEELGISFQYPTTLGKVWENKYKETELFALKFLDDKGNPADLGLGGSDYETLRTCDDILSKGFADGDKMPSDCETLTVDNQSVIILTYTQGGMSNSYTYTLKEAQFQTKKGVWAFSSTDKDLYNDLMNLVKTLKYVQ